MKNNAQLFLDLSEQLEKVREFISEEFTEFPDNRKKCLMAIDVAQGEIQTAIAEYLIITKSHPVVNEILFSVGILMASLSKKIYPDKEVNIDFFRLSDELYRMNSIEIEKLVNGDDDEVEVLA